MSQGLPILDGIRVASPCLASWDAMAGDDRQRHCRACGKDVYNLSALTTEAALALVARSGPTPCVRFYRRADGTVLTADCPVGLRAIRGRRVAQALVSGAGILVAGAAALLASVKFGRDSDPTPANLQPSLVNIQVKLTDWYNEALIWVGLRQRPALLGEMARCPLPPTLGKPALAPKSVTGDE